MSDQPLTSEQLKNWRLVVGDLPDDVIQGLRRRTQAEIDVNCPMEAAVRILRDGHGLLIYGRELREWWIASMTHSHFNLTAQQATQLLSDHRQYIKKVFSGDATNQYKWVDVQRDAEYAQYVEDKTVGGLE
jgi:hypothetical protein